MTVCIAAMCQSPGGPMVLAASDRMLTAGDIQFEPQNPKVFALSNSVIVMTAGDSSLQAEIVQAVSADMAERIRKEPQNWWRIVDVASLYQSHSGRVLRRNASDAILSRLGLTEETFISRQGEMDPAFVRMVATELLNFQNPPQLAAIITGVDPTGAHIYTSNGVGIGCQDTVGFACVGSGARHAESQFMLAGHSARRSFPETLHLTYSAKRRSEVAPGVGEATDMFLVGPALGGSAAIGDHVLKALEEIYRDTLRREKRAVSAANAKVNRYVEELGRQVAEREQTADMETPGGEASVDVPPDGGTPGAEATRAE